MPDKLEKYRSESAISQVLNNARVRRNLILSVLGGALIALAGARVYHNIQDEPEMDLDKIMNRINKPYEAVRPVPAEEVKPTNEDDNGAEKKVKKEKRNDNSKGRKKSKDKPAKQEMQPEEDDDYEYEPETALG